MQKKIHFSKSFSGCHILQQAQRSIALDVGFKKQMKDHHFKHLWNSLGDFQFFSSISSLRHRTNFDLG